MILHLPIAEQFHHFSRFHNFSYYLFKDTSYLFDLLSSPWPPVIVVFATYMLCQCSHKLFFSLDSFILPFKLYIFFLFSFEIDHEDEGGADSGQPPATVERVQVV